MNDGLAFFRRRFCSHNLCIYASLVKLNSQKISVVYVDAERDCRQVPAVLQPVLDDIAHQRGTAHDLRQLRLVVVGTVLQGRRGFNPFQIRLCGCVKFVFAQVAALDQLADGGWLNQSVIVFAQERGKRCTRQADHFHAFFAQAFDILQDAFFAQVRFVDNQQIDIVREYATNKRIGAGDLYFEGRIVVWVIRPDIADFITRQPILHKTVCCLGNEDLVRRAKHYPHATTDEPRNDEGGQSCFTAARRRVHHEGFCILPVTAQLVKCSFLCKIRCDRQLHCADPAVMR